MSAFDSANQSKVKAYLYAMFEFLDSQANRPVRDKIRNVLYLDVDGVLQYADGGCWRPRLEAEDFLAWAVQYFDCRWLTAWARPNASLPSKLGIKVPPGIVEIKLDLLTAEKYIKTRLINIMKFKFLGPRTAELLSDFAGTLWLDGLEGLNRGASRKQIPISA